ncbi:hypothetical protein [Spirosoma areae]
MHLISVVVIKDKRALFGPWDDQVKHKDLLPFVAGLVYSPPPTRWNDRTLAIN